MINRPPPERPLALGSRFWAAAIDAAVAFVLIPLGPTLFWLAPDPDVRQYAVLLAVSYTLYSFACHWRWRRTLGKQMYGLSVVRADGASPGCLRSVLREVVRGISLPVLFAPPILFGSLSAASIRWEWAGFRGAFPHDAVLLAAAVGTFFAAFILVGILLTTPVVRPPMRPAIAGMLGIYDYVVGIRVVEDAGRSDADLQRARQVKMAALFGAGPFLLTIASQAPNRFVFLGILLACMGAWLSIRFLCKRLGRPVASVVPGLATWLYGWAMRRPAWVKVASAAVMVLVVALYCIRPTPEPLTPVQVWATTVCEAVEYPSPHQTTWSEWADLLLEGRAVWARTSTPSEVEEFRSTTLKIFQERIWFAQTQPPDEPSRLFPYLHAYTEDLRDIYRNADAETQAALTAYGCIEEPR